LMPSSFGCRVEWMCADDAVVEVHTQIVSAGLPPPQGDFF
jgi:hypothetical protein